MKGGKNLDIKNFPLTVTGKWLEEVGKAVKSSSASTKHEFIIQAVNEKIARQKEAKN